MEMHQGAGSKCVMLGVSKLPEVPEVWIILSALCTHFRDAGSHSSWSSQEPLKFRSLAKPCSSDAFLFHLSERGDSLKV